MINADAIRAIAGNKSIHPGVIEKDYILSKTLMALATNPEFRKSLVFKGGTALKKCYYPDWRYSEDLDFTSRSPLTPDQIQGIFRQAAENVGDMFGLTLRVSEFSQYPKNSDDIESAQLKLAYNGPLRQTSGQKNNIRVDIALSEEIIQVPPERGIVNEYADDVAAAVSLYALEEIVAEKLRSILQRGKSRDYFDVCVLLNDHAGDFDFALTRDILKKKCASKQIPAPQIDDFFVPSQLAEAQRFWVRGLAHQMESLPAFNQVIESLRSRISHLLGGNH